MFAFVLLLFAFSKSGASSPVTLNPITPSLDVPVELQHTWAQYSPYFPVEKYVSPPRNCEITQIFRKVNIIQRHGARFPTTGATTRIKAAMAKLESVKHLTDPRLDFLRSFKYDLGADDLVPFGAAQSFDAGQEAFKRYVHLVGDDNLPFVRASSSERVVFSANNWTQGFAAASERRFAPVVSVVLDEAANDTLDDAMCPNASGSDAQTNAWLAVYAPPITDRLNKGAPGANLTDVDTYNLISLCPFETVFNEKKSPFCDLFESEPGAFSGFAYSGDLDKYYNTGYGQELGRIQGVGYVNELIARLTESPVRDNTQTNRTLDASPITFPLNRTIYADFSHDNQMIAIFAAIGLLKPARALDPTHPDPNRTWRAANLVPFSARMVVERLSCDEKEEKVRIFVNDALQPLEFCGAGKDGLCDLDAFVESQAYARNDGAGDFAKCFS
ncbi:phytase [Panus rudis PR-1116 ss-1]|nr:phytase [Panus rudis PR-1116 ss-1]